MRIRHHLPSLWRRRWILATAMCAGAAMAIALSVRQPAVYLAEAQIFLAPDTGAARASSNEAAADELAPYAMHVESLAMAQTVIRRESLDFRASELAAKLEADVLPEIRVVSVGVTDSDARQAQNLANAVATAFVEEGVRQVDRGDARAAVLDAAPLPTEPVSPKPVRDGFIGLALGALAGILLTYILKGSAPKSRKEKAPEIFPESAVITAASPLKTPPRVDLKPAKRSTQDWVPEDRDLDEGIEAAAMDEEEPAPVEGPKDPFAIHPATRTFRPESDRSPARATAPLGEDDPISVRIREAVRRGMSGASSREGDLVGRHPESEPATKPVRRRVTAGQAEAEKQETLTGTDATGPEADYEDFWQMGRSHHDSDEKQKAEPKTKKKRV